MGIAATKFQNSSSNICNLLLVQTPKVLYIFKDTVMMKQGIAIFTKQTATEPSMRERERESDIQQQLYLFPKKKEKEIVNTVQPRYSIKNQIK